MLDKLKQNIRAATSQTVADLVIKNVTIFHLTTGRMEVTDIAIVEDKIVGVAKDYQGKKEIDGSGLYAVPSFIDAHVHIESSMINPFEFERLLLNHGVTCAVCDPHELANVFGTDAIDYFLECAENLTLDLNVQIPSCVPATSMDTSGAELYYNDIKKYVDANNSIGLAEMMNVPAVLNCDDDVLKKILAFKHVDGHAPLVSGKALNGYVTAGVRNCHESTNYDEAIEKLERGMHVFVREGSVAKNLATLTPLITIENSPFLSLCTDDRDILDIVNEGHLDYLIRKIIANGVSPLVAYRIASWSTAKHFKMNNRGLIAPSYLADIVLLSDLEECKIEKVIKSGKVIDEESLKHKKRTSIPKHFYNSVKCRDFTSDDFRIKANSNKVDVIQIIPSQILTKAIKANLPIKNDEVLMDIEQDILKLAVIERHGKNGNFAVSFTKGFNIKKGAIASSVAHDSHNISVVGASETDMAIAVNTIKKSQGGFVIVIDGKVVSQLELPIGGLISDLSYEELYKHLEEFHAKAKLTGTNLKSAVLQLAFLSLPVIPEIRLTDCGLAKLG